MPQHNQPTEIIPATYALVYEAKTHGARFYVDVGVLLPIASTDAEQLFYNLAQDPTHTMASIERNTTTDYIEKITLYKAKDSELQDILTVVDKGRLAEDPEYKPIIS